MIPRSFLPGSAVRRGLLGSMALVAGGCAGFRPTRADQERSLAAVGAARIAAPRDLWEDASGDGAGIPPKTFLDLVFVGVIGARDAMTAARVERAFGPGVAARPREAGASPGAVRRAVTVGSGVAVTGDGYIVTAAHAVRLAEILVVGADRACASGAVRVARGRIVFADRAADFALIKCDLATPHFLACRTDLPPASTLLYSGGWWNRSGAGRLLEMKALRSAAGVRFRALRTSIPIVEGDSGSAVVDSEGRLLGVSIRYRYGRFWRLPPESTAMMLAPADLAGLIARDRADRRPALASAAARTSGALP